MTRSCLGVDVAPQRGLQTPRVIRVRHVRCWRSICCGCRLPGRCGRSRWAGRRGPNDRGRSGAVRRARTALGAAPSPRLCGDPRRRPRPCLWGARWPATASGGACVPDQRPPLIDRRLPSAHQVQAPAAGAAGAAPRRLPRAAPAPTAKPQSVIPSCTPLSSAFTRPCRASWPV